MVKKNYQIQLQVEKNIAKAFLSNQRISLKFATELCREIKGKKLSKAERFLQDIMEHRAFLPLRVYRKKVAHRKGESKSFTKSGRYPERVCRVFLKLLDLVKANADFKGLDTESLGIVHAFASQGLKRYSFQPKGRITGKRRARKSAHIEVVVREFKEAEKK